MKRLAALLAVCALCALLPATAAHARPRPMSHVTSPTRSAAPPVAHHPVTFPADTFAHPDVGIEWWYYVGHLADAAGRTYGFEATFFRFGGLHRYGSPFDTLYRTDVAVTDEAGRRFYHAITYAPATPFTVASTSTLRLRAGTLDVSTLGPLRYRIHGVAPGTRVTRGTRTTPSTAATPDAAVDLDAASVRPPMLVGGGYTGWGAGYTYYYSLTHMRASGTLTIGGRRIPVRGVVWNDHQWGDMGGTSVKGWDWMALQLGDGADMSLANERPSNVLDATWAQALLPSGAHPFVRQVTIAPLAHWTSPTTGTTYPMGWRVRVPRLGLDVVVRPTLPDQEMVDRGFLGFSKSYWEGSATVAGTHNGRPVTGKAYVELTGYDKTSTAP